MSKFSKADLANNPNLQKLIAQKDLQALGIPTQPPTTPTKPTLKDTWDNLSPAAKRALKGTEARQHAIIVNWLAKHQIPHIHAPTSRKVHDLPTGWPDFTVFKLQVNLNFAHALFLEIKTPGGHLSFEQDYWLSILPVHILPDAYSAIKTIALFTDTNLPVFHPHPNLPL